MPLFKRLGHTDRVRFPEYVLNEQTPRVYRDADALLLPSYSEGLSNVILDAMAAGLVVVASDIGENMQFSAMINAGFYSNREM